MSDRHQLHLSIVNSKAAMMITKKIMRDASALRTRGTGSTSFTVAVFYSSQTFVGPTPVLLGPRAL